MTKRVKWTRRAKAALAALVAWTSETDPDVAEALRNTITDRAEQLGRFPHLGPPSQRGTRKLLVTGTPYIIIYRETRERVSVVGLWHHAQRKRSK
jgi:toxin ParE1/3/4